MQFVLRTRFHPFVNGICLNFVFGSRVVKLRGGLLKVVNYVVSGGCSQLRAVCSFWLDIVASAVAQPEIAFGVGDVPMDESSTAEETSAGLKSWPPKSHEHFGTTAVTGRLLRS